MTNLQKLFPSNLDTVPERLTNMRKIIEKKEKKYPLFFLRNLQMVPYGGFFFLYLFFLQ